MDLEHPVLKSLFAGNGLQFKNCWPFMDHDINKEPENVFLNYCGSYGYEGGIRTLGTRPLIFVIYYYSIV
jgi:hypothetical protein